MSTGQCILVTGARGFLGSHIVERGQLKGLNVVAAYRGASAAATVPLDICNVQNVDTAFREVRPSFVIHCAAYGVNYAEQDPNAALAVNVHGTLSLLEAAARHGAKRFVHIGSCFEYGSHPGRISEDAPLNPTAIYGATKAAATILLRERAHALGVLLVIARPFAIWGPGEAKYRVIPQVITACINQSALKLTSCEVLRDYMYIEDVAESILALTTVPKIPSGTVVNIGTGNGVLLRDFVASVARHLGGQDLMQFGALPYRPTEMPSLVADTTRMQQLLGEGARTSVEEGLRRMMNRDYPDYADRGRNALPA
jgi:nucleoside-diphosphate-sugar epimerase